MSEEGRMSIQESTEALGRALAWSREVGRCCPAWWPRRWTRAHYVEHVAGDERGMVGGVLGWIWAESGHEPNTKIEARMKLYVFH